MKHVVDFSEDNVESMFERLVAWFSVDSRGAERL